MATLAAVAGAGAGFMFADELEQRLGLAEQIEMGDQPQLVYAATLGIAAYIFLQGTY